MATDSKSRKIGNDVVSVWGLPLVPWTMDETLDEIDRLVAARAPSFFVTANLYYAMLTDQHADIRAVNDEAAFVVADGMPLVWAARGRLPERVTGSDMIFRLSARAAERGHRLFFLGGAPGVGERAIANLRARYPGLNVVGCESPPNVSTMSEEEVAALAERLRAAGTDILLAALSQPKGERWLAKVYRRLGVPVCAQLGASLDFAAGRVKRAPKWMQKTGLEFLFRFLQEPRRLGGRYWRCGVFYMKMVARDVLGRKRGFTTEEQREQRKR